MFAQSFQSGFSADTIVPQTHSGDMAISTLLPHFEFENHDSRAHMALHSGLIDKVNRLKHIHFLSYTNFLQKLNFLLYLRKPIFCVSQHTYGGAGGDEL
jgi:hypothetical protein